MTFNINIKESMTHILNNQVHKAQLTAITQAPGGKVSLHVIKKRCYMSFRKEER